MFALLAKLLLAFSVSGSARSGAQAVVDHFGADAETRISDKVRVLVAQSINGDEDDPSADESDGDSDLEAIPPPPAAGKPRLRIDIGDDANANADLPKFSETARNVPAVEVLHRIARTAGWSLTIVGVAKERIDIDVKDA